MTGWGSAPAAKLTAHLMPRTADIAVFLLFDNTTKHVYNPNTSFPVWSE